MSFVQGTLPADRSALTTIRDELLLSSHVFRSICIKFGDTLLLVARGLELGSM